MGVIEGIEAEDAVFAGAPEPQGGVLAPPDRPGLGIEVR